MKIAEGINKRVGICDIECYRELFDVGIYDEDKGEWIEFEVSKWKNELYQFVKYYTSKPFDYLVTFNGVDYDQQVLEWIVKSYDDWYDLDNLEICAKISRQSGMIIENKNYGVHARFREEHFSIPALDLMKIHHFDGDQRWTSLKWCAFMMNMTVEEMPVPFWKTDLTQQEILDVRKYRRNDVWVTRGLFYLTMGQLDKVIEINGGYPLDELKDYEGKNKIQDRFDVNRETGLKCLNWSDVKIGEEWNKLDYMKAEGIKDSTILIPKTMTSIYGQKFKNFFPKTMEFTTLHFQNFIKFVGEQKIRKKMRDGEKKQEYKLKIGSSTYTFAKGGIHTNEKDRKIIPAPGYILRDADVGSQYPNSIVKFEIYGPHLKITILQQYQGKIKKRIYYKNLAKELKAQGKKDEARVYTSIQEMLKLCLNGGYFGKLGQPGSFLEYQEGLVKCCVGNEIEILMAVEMMEEAGFQVLSANTDGFVTLFPADKEDIYKQICAKWEEKVGNKELGKLEYTDFVGLWQESINSYIARKVEKDKEGNLVYSTKKKGGFCTEFEMHRDKSERVIPLALEAYFIDGKDPIEFIKNHKNIFDFCIGVKASKGMYYEEQWEEGDQIKTKTHKKLVVYYISKKGTVLWKRGFNNKGKPVNNQCNAPYTLGQPLVTYFNEIFKSDDYGIDYNYYIFNTLERIDAIEKTKKAQRFVEQQREHKQMSLF